MNGILPRLGSQKDNGLRNILVSGGMRSARGGDSVLRRIGGGVSGRVVLANSFIKQGGLVRVTAYHPEAERKRLEEAARRKAAKAAEEKRRAAIKAESEKRTAVLKQESAKGVEVHEADKPRRVGGQESRADVVQAEEVKPITEKEERLADLLEAAQEMKPLAETVGAGVENVPAMKVAELEDAAGMMAEGGMAAGDGEKESGQTIPNETGGEAPLPVAAGKKRGRKGKRGRKAKEAGFNGLV